MGDAADQALERAQRDIEHFDKFQDADLATQYEEGIIDETGSIIGNPNSFPGVTQRRPAPKGLWDM